MIIVKIVGMSIQKEKKMETKRIVFITPSDVGTTEFIQMVPEGSDVQIKHVKVAPFFDSNIEKAIALFRPGLIILGMMLQGKDTDGLKVLEKIKNSEHLKHVPVVVVSSVFQVDGEDHHLQNLRSRATKLGAVAVLPRFPFPSYDELVSYYCDD